MPLFNSLREERFKSMTDSQREEYRSQREQLNDLLVAFVRHLVREVSGDLLHLAMYAAMSDTGATKEDGKRLLSALRREQRESSIWPKGFMPEL